VCVSFLAVLGFPVCWLCCDFQVSLNAITMVGTDGVVAVCSAVRTSGHRSHTLRRAILHILLEARLVCEFCFSYGCGLRFLSVECSLRSELGFSVPPFRLS